jgi:hypothetical protein
MAVEWRPHVPMETGKVIGGACVSLHVVKNPEGGV